MTQTLQQFFAALDKYSSRVPLDVLTDRIEDLEIDMDTVRPYLVFGETTYRRNLMHAGSGYQALILCWRAGQHSPIHDHRGSSCGVRVLTGVATETVFERGEQGQIVPTHTRELYEGQVCGSQDADIHQLSNLQGDDRDLVTLHVYSPPLLKMGTYSLADPEVSEFLDPVFEFADGGGI